MGEREWSDVVMMVNGQPIRVLQEVDFGDDEPGTAVTSKTALRVSDMAMGMLRLAKAITVAKLALERLRAMCYAWPPRYRFRSRVEKRRSRTRLKQRPTRLQRRRQRQTKNKVKP